MWDEDSKLDRVRLLPAAGMAGSVLDEMISALGEVEALVAPAGSTAARQLRTARAELLRHRAEDGAPTILSQDAALSLAVLLEEARSSSVGCGRHAAAFVAQAIKATLLEALLDPQPSSV